MLIEKEDFYWDENGLMVFTREYHLKRGYCCKNGCKNCPWNYRQRKEKKNRRDDKPHF